MQTVPFFSLKEQWESLKPEITQALADVCESQAFIGGKYIAEIEEKLAEYTTAKHAISCSSGTTALWLALAALNLQKNNIVLTTPFSFIASSSEIYAHGGHPVFIDIDQKNYTIDPNKLVAWLESNTHEKNNIFYENKTGYPVTGILAVNIFGRPAEWDKISEIAKKYNLWTVEDAAQSIGAQYNNKHSGTLADIGCFSCYPTKNLGAYGDAGFVTTNNPELATRLIELRNHGRQSHYNYNGYGINGRMDAFQAVVLLEKLKHIDSYNNSRKAIAQKYTESFKDLPGIKLQEIGDHIVNPYHQFTLEINSETLTISRDQFIEKLNARGVQSRVFYPESLDTIPYLQTDSRLARKPVISHALCSNILALPIYPELPDTHIDAVISAVTAILSENYSELKNQNTQTEMGI